jgi:hypothetical protein
MLNMLSQDLNNMQHYGGMNYRLRDAVKVRKKSKAGI